MKNILSNLFKRDKDNVTPSTNDPVAKDKVKTVSKSEKGDESDKKKEGVIITEEHVPEKKDDTVGKKKTTWSGVGKHTSTFWFPKIVKKKLTIILLENTKKSFEERENILKIVNRLLSSDLVCTITYGSTVKVGCVKKAGKFDDKDLFDTDDLKDNACLYDALRILNKVVKLAFKKARYDEFGIDQYKISSIDIIGIGSGIDASSKIDKEGSLKVFDEVLSNTSVETKYFCFSEDSFKEVASIGFRSIGAFPSKKKE